MRTPASPIQLDELRAFLCITECGSFTDASRVLGRSQPAVSRRIRQLEESLGTPLFDRSERRVRLTDAGRALLPHAEAALAAVRDGECAVQDALGAADGAADEPQTLRLAIVGTLADSHLVEALRAFEARFPRASVDVRTATSREVSGLVRGGHADLGLRYFPDADPRLDSTLVGSERLYAIVPAKHPVASKRIRDLRRLEGERWLGFPPERGQDLSHGRLLEKALALTGGSFTPVDSLTAQKRLVEAGMGVALMPLSSVREEVRLGTLRAIQVDRLGAELPVVAVRRRRAHRSRLAEAFLDLLRESA